MEKIQVKISNQRKVFRVHACLFRRRISRIMFSDNLEGVDNKKIKKKKKILRKKLES